MWPFKHHDCKCHNELKAIHEQLEEIARLLKSIVPTSKRFESYTIVQNSKGATMKQKLVSPPGGVVGQVSNFTAIGAPTGVVADRSNHLEVRQSE